MKLAKQDKRAARFGRAYLRPAARAFRSLAACERAAAIIFRRWTDHLLGFRPRMMTPRRPDERR